VLEHLTKESLKRGEGVDRSRSRFLEDLDIPEKFRAKLADYVKSGYDRGHMAPAGDAKYSQGAMDQTFLLSNIAPQVGNGFNRDCMYKITNLKI
jgi:endonuclease G